MLVNGGFCRINPGETSLLEIILSTVQLDLPLGKLIHHDLSFPPPLVHFPVECFVKNLRNINSGWKVVVPLGRSNNLTTFNDEFLKSLMARLIKISSSRKAFFDIYTWWWIDEKNSNISKETLLNLFGLLKRFLLNFSIFSKRFFVNGTAKELKCDQFW